MLTPDDRLHIGLKVLERLKPSSSSRRRRPLPPMLHTERSIDMEISESQAAEPIEYTPSSSFYLPSLQGLLSQIGPLSPYSLILGSCEDGLPFLLDLTNPTPGSLLITGDTGSGKTRLIRSVLASAILLNAPGQVSFSIISQNPEEFLCFSQTANCHEIMIPEEAAAGEILDDLASAAEQRLVGNEQGSAFILTIDDLVQFMQTLDDQSLANLHWLIQEGPRARIWVVASLLSDYAGLVGEAFLSSFGTRLIGRILSPELIAYLAGDTYSGAADLAAGYQFSTPFGGEWIRFWICESE